MKLFFKTFGEGKPLLILHGLFGSSDNWQTLAKSLSSYYKVYLIDQRNHGHSPQSDDFTFELMAEDLYELAAEEGLRDLLLIGHSMGGKTILHFAQKYGFLIDKMIVADMGIKAYTPHHDEIFNALFAVDVNHCETRRLAEERLSVHVSDTSTKQFLLKNLYWKEPAKLDWRFNLSAIYNKRDEIIKAIPLLKIDNDVLFLRGAKSNYVTDEDLPFIKQLVPAAKFETIPDVGHWLHAEAPDIFLEKCLEFLEG